MSALGCGVSERATAAPEAPRGARWPEVVVVTERDDTPEGGDGAPRLSLAFRYADGSRVPIEGEARSYAPFRDGVALVDLEGKLVLVSPRGARRVLARDAGAPPVRGPAGELLYVARYGLEAELHVLDATGRDRVLASGFASAGVLAPQADGRVFFVAARSGGVAGLWLADEGGARCLTNCDLGRAPWGDAFVPPPGDRDAIEVRGQHVRWQAFDGTLRSLDLSSAPRVPAGHTTPRTLGQPR